MSALEYVNPIYNALRILSKDRTPRQLAMAVALGMMIGLLPKGNLLAAGFTVMLLTLRVNLGVGLTTAFLVTLLSGSIDPLTHGIGLRMLRNPTVHPFLSQLHQWPVVPWMSLNNSVVLGSFVLGIGLFYPTYHGSERAFQRLMPVLRARLGKEAAAETRTADKASQERIGTSPQATTDSGYSADSARSAPAASSIGSSAVLERTATDSAALPASAPASESASLAPADLLAALGNTSVPAQSWDIAALNRPPVMTRAALPTRKLSTTTTAADRLRRAMPPEPPSLHAANSEPTTTASPFASLLPPSSPATGPLADARASDPARGHLDAPASKAPEFLG